MCISQLFLHNNSQNISGAYDTKHLFSLTGVCWLGSADLCWIQLGFMADLGRASSRLDWLMVSWHSLLLTHGRVSLFILLNFQLPGQDPPTLDRTICLTHLRIVMLMSSKNTFKETLKIIFDQISEHPINQSG